MYVMTLEELQERRNNKNTYKTDHLGLTKVGSSYLYTLQDTAEYYAEEVTKRKYDLIRIYQKLSKKFNDYKKSIEELEQMDSDDIMDYILDMLCDLCGYDN